MERKKNSKKIVKKIFLSLLVLIVLAGIAAFATIKIINSSYEYDTIGASNLLKAGETGTGRIYYYGADNMPEYDDFTYKAGETIELPKLTREGYIFMGWNVSSGRTVGANEVVYSKHVEYCPCFSKDRSSITTPVAVYTNEFDYIPYEIGEYNSVYIANCEIYIDGGYKVSLYTEENFAGDIRIVAYTGGISGEYKSMKVEKVDTAIAAKGEMTDELLYDLCVKFAPRIWFAEKEVYFPATVDEAKENLDYELTDIGYSIIDKSLNKPLYKDDFYYGNLDSAQAYCFASEKDTKYVDLMYYVYFPYNFGKKILGIEFGNHIGDWEHVSVRVMREEVNGEINWRPVCFINHVHSDKQYHSWDELTFIDETHPVVYCAEGSHGFWITEGANVYEDRKIIKLKDICNEGTAWDLWKDDNMATYSYDVLLREGYGIGNTQWNSIFGINVYDSNSGAVINWGNKKWEPKICIYPQLVNGPDGPQHKTVLRDYYLFY